MGKNDTAADGFKAPTARSIRRVHELLVAQYGHHTVTPRDPLDGLVLIILSQATNDLNCDRAFTSLKERFPTWDDVLAAPVADVAAAIRHGGLANQKAARIQAILRDIKARQGDLDLTWMHTAPPEQSRAFMEEFHGVGPKTVACVLVFYLGKPAFPVDTHVQRVTRRLGWIRPNAGTDEAHRVLAAAVPDDCKLDLHCNLITHGRTVCRAEGNGGPRCGACVLRANCHYGRNLRLARGQKAHDEAHAQRARQARGSDFFVTVKAKRRPDTAASNQKN